MKRHYTAALILGVAAILSACGAGGEAKTQEQTKNTVAVLPKDSSAEADTKDVQEEPVQVKIGVTGAVHEMIWAPAIEKLKKEGIEVELVQFSDFTLPNNALANGELDLNAFQHLLYLDNEKKEHGYEISKIANEYSSHMNLFSDKISSIDELKPGDVIAIPNDVTNGGAALKVLRDAGIIKLKEDAAFSPTLEDVTENPYGVEIRELAANTIPSALPDVAAAIVNINYALDYGLKMEDALFVGKLKEEEYWTLIAARTADLQDPERVALFDKIIDAIQSDETKKVYEDTFGGYYEASGWDEDFLAPYRTQATETKAN